MLGRVRSGLARFFPLATWVGVYSRFGDVPARGGYERDHWILATRERTEQELRDPVPAGDALPLVLVTGAFLGTSPRARILDFGGGMGTAYVALRRSLGPTAQLEHTVVELPRVADVGRELFLADTAIRFTHDLPAGPFDIVHACAALQYVEDPFQVLRALLRYGAPYVLISKVPAGSNPTYVTGQLNLPGSVVPCWMFELAEIERTVRDAGYAVLSRTWSETSLIRAYRTAGIPARLRPERMVGLLLAPASSAIVPRSTRL